jgi:hypothetical protein
VSVGRSAAHARFWFLTSDRRILSGAIAQLGERLLCKQEVVGSIPSGSTNSIRRSCQEPNFREVAYAALRALFHIVKRGLTRGFLIAARRMSCGGSRLPRSAKPTAFAVGSISMKIWS